MATYPSDAPVYSSYVEAYLAGSKSSGPADAGSRTSTARFGHRPAGTAHRFRKPSTYVEGNPVPNKTISVLQRPTKPPSSKNVENIDADFQREVTSFQRRANIYRRHALNPYHHNAPPGSILTTFEQGHIVDKGRRKSHVHEARGVYDPVAHTYRVPPADDVTASKVSDERPCSAPNRRPSAPQHVRPTTPHEHKLLQMSRGSYNPLTHEYKESPEPEYVQRKEKEFDRVHGLGNGMRRIPPSQEVADPIRWVPSKPVSGGSSGSSSQTSSTGGAVLSEVASAPAALDRGQRPSSAPSGQSGLRKTMSGPSWGTYNPLTHEWQVPPTNEKFVQQEAVIQRRLGISGSSAGRTSTPRQQGVYNPILNTWTVPPSNPRLIDGLSFVPATTFSRPTPATIRM